MTCFLHHCSEAMSTERSSDVDLGQDHLCPAFFGAQTFQEGVLVRAESQRRGFFCSVEPLAPNIRLFRQWAGVVSAPEGKSSSDTTKRVNPEVLMSSVYASLVLEVFLTSSSRKGRGEDIKCPFLKKLKYGTHQDHRVLAFHFPSHIRINCTFVVGHFFFPFTLSVVLASGLFGFFFLHIVISVPRAE